MISGASKSQTDNHNNLPINFPASNLSTLQSNLNKNISPITSLPDSKPLNVSPLNLAWNPNYKQSRKKIPDP